MAQKRRNRNTPHTAKYQRNAQNAYPIQGNVAYKLQPKEEPMQMPAKKPQPQIGETRTERREKRRHMLYVCAVMLLVFGGCIAFMGANVIVAKKEMQIRQQNNTLSAIKAQNATLEAELAEQIDLEYIKQEASKRLGMAEPQPYQIVYIDVPKQSYTIQYAADETEKKESSFFDSLMNLWKKD